jgi:uncharacterized membrane protein YeaQ/YmgE (transglycosylase-associated protein family)
MRSVPAVLVLGIILFGLVVGAAAQWLTGRDGAGIDWGLALVAGLVGSFVGGLLFSLIAGDGLDFRPSGVIGSIIGAVIITAGWKWWQSRSKPAPAPASRRR